MERLPLRAKIEDDGERLRLDVQNQSSQDLIDCWLVAPGTRVFLGNLPKGEGWTKTFPLGSVKAEENRGRGSDEMNLREVTFNDKTRDILFHSSFFPRDGSEAPWRAGAAVFFGWVKDPEKRVEVGDPRIKVHNYALYRLIVPLAGGDDE
jgi:hypothetical protein